MMKQILVLHFLLKMGDVNYAHKLSGEEVYIHMEGSDFIVTVFGKNGTIKQQRVGRDTPKSVLVYTAEPMGEYGLIQAFVSPGLSQQNKVNYSRSILTTQMF
jgi:predicted cupin superfamily sugar epimerase